MEELKKLLSAVAPWLAAATAGPAGLATQAVVTIAKALGNPSANAQDAAALLMHATPDQLVEVRQAEQDFKLRMQALGFSHIEKMEELSISNTGGARDANSTSGIQKQVFWFICVVCLVVLGVEGAVLFKGLPSSTDPMLAGRILGTFDAVMVTAVNYLLGSSSGSAAAREALVSLTKRSNP